jgi:hypothetical protein
MSRFETSTFVRNDAIMHQSVLEDACKLLGWSYKHENNSLLIMNLGNNTNFHGEYAIKVSENKVTYNTYYYGNTSSEVERLKAKFNELNVSYTQNLLIAEFKKKGFSFKKNSKFVESIQEKLSFFMVGRSKNKLENEPVGEIKFTILYDGTIVSDSNYLPEDVNERAHSAMDSIDTYFGSKRIMTKKEIPAKYRDRVTHSKNIQKLNRK